MKKFLKHGSLVALTICLLFNLCSISAFAMTNRISTAENVFSEKLDVDQLRALNFTESDIARLLEYERAHDNCAPSIRPLVDLPSNPKDGDVYIDTLKISLDTLIVGGTSAADIALKVANITSIPISVAVLVGVFVANLIKDNVSFDGIELVIEWRYGLTNDLTMGWSSYIKDIRTY